MGAEPTLFDQKEEARAERVTPKEEKQLSAEIRELNDAFTKLTLLVTQQGGSKKENREYHQPRSNDRRQVHWKDSSPQPRRNSDFACSFCGKRGHSFKECFSRKNALRREEEEEAAAKRSQTKDAAMVEQSEVEVSDYDSLAVKRSAPQAKSRERGRQRTAEGQKPTRKKAAAKRRTTMMQDRSHYSVSDDLTNSLANITFGQLFEIAPHVRQALKSSLKLEQSDEVQQKAKDKGEDLEEGEIPRDSPREAMDTTLAEVPGVKSLIVAATIGGKLLPKVVIDPGSMVNLLAERHFDHSKRTLKPSPIKLNLANGASTIPSGQAKLTVQIQGVKSKELLRVIPDPCGYDAILGKPWLRAVQATSDWSTDRHVIYDRHGTHYYLDAPPEEDDSTKKRGDFATV
ncbi:hypothetical protein BSKO_12022 [Bryopsis sp. KO-2023]|nr:hypothetical protein BSKO_12022 [Bryopsis sp. KO-2023]